MINHIFPWKKEKGEAVKLPPVPLVGYVKDFASDRTRCR